MFHLIEFLINKTVAVVPQTWCRDGVVYWPNYRNDERVNRAVKNSEEPGPDWKTYDVRVIKTCDDYFEAQRLLKKSLMCNTSDLQSEEEEEEMKPKRRPKPIHFFGDTDDDSEEEGHPHKKRARGPAKLLTEPPAPVISPPAPVISTPPFIPSSGTAAPPPLTSPPHCAQRPAEEQTPSTRKVYRPTCCSCDTSYFSPADVLHCLHAPQLPPDPLGNTKTLSDSDKPRKTFPLPARLPGLSSRQCCLNRCLINLLLFVPLTSVSLVCLLTRSSSDEKIIILLNEERRQKRRRYWIHPIVKRRTWGNLSADSSSLSSINVCSARPFCA